jgi:hypothetical protein
MTLQPLTSAAVPALKNVAAGAPRRSLGFLGDIKGLVSLQAGPEVPFRLASIARILYPVGCLACERLWP